MNHEKVDEPLTSMPGKAMPSLLAICGDVPAAKMLLLLAILSFCPQNDIVRLPVFLVVSELTDIVALRLVLSILFAETVYARTMTQMSLIQLFSRNRTEVEQDTVLLDLTGASAAFIPYVMPLCKCRAVPKSHIALMRKDMLGSALIYGGVIGILSEDVWGMLDSDELGLEIIPRRISLVDLGVIQTSLEGVASEIQGIGRGMILRPRDSKLSPQRFAGSVAWRGFLILEDLARQLDQKFPNGGFGLAVKSVWEDFGERILQNFPSSRRKAILAGHILWHIRNTTADGPDGMFTVSGIASGIAKRDKELFPELDGVAVGRFLRGSKIGTKNPHRYIQTLNDEREWHTVYRFSELDKRRLQERAAGEEGNCLISAAESTDVNRKWLLSTFAGCKNVAPSEIEFKSKALQRPLSISDIFRILEELAKSGVILKSDDSHYDFTAVAAKSGREE